MIKAIFLLVAIILIGTFLDLGVGAVCKEIGDKVRIYENFKI